jgi:hypothetical protein
LIRSLSHRRMTAICAHRTAGVYVNRSWKARRWASRRGFRLWNRRCRRRCHTCGTASTAAIISSASAISGIRGVGSKPLRAGENGVGVGRTALRGSHGSRRCASGDQVRDARRGHSSTFRRPEPTGLAAPFPSRPTSRAQALLNRSDMGTLKTEMVWESGRAASLASTDARQAETFGRVAEKSGHRRRFRHTAQAQRRERHQ